jgi:hypothetical protein
MVPAVSAIAAEVRLSAIAPAEAGLGTGIVEEAAWAAERIASAAVTCPEAEPATGVPSAEAAEDSADAAQPATAAVALRVSDLAAAGAVQGAVAVAGGGRRL